MEVFDRVQMARQADRPTGSDYIKNIITDFIELHGDKRYGDDKAIIAGIGYLFDIPVTVVAQEKGHDTNSKIECNFGCAHPEGYRKALRQFKLAEKFCRPVITFVDTSGAYCGLGAEERGQGQAIAENLTTLMTLKTQVISVLIGEGGSGGALALAVADEVWMLKNSVYSVISPEGCASILWKDPSKTKEAAQHLKITAEDLYSLRIIEKIIPETDGFEKVYSQLKNELYKTIQMYKTKSMEELLDNRYNKYRKIGGYNR